jgi:hypothetical protein
MFGASEAKNLARTIRGVVKLLLEVAHEGAASLTPARVRDLKGIARGLARVRLRRLSSKLLEFARAVGSALRHEQGGSAEIAHLLTDCVQTAKLVKTHLKSGTTRPEVLDEVFECKWTADQLTPLKNRVFVEMALTSEPYEKTSRLDNRYYIDLGSGDVVVQRTLIPFPQSEEALPPKPRDGVIYVGRAQAFPGYPPREIRFADASETGGTLDEKALKQLLSVAQPSVVALAETFSRRSRNFFAPPVTYAMVTVHALVALRQDVHVMDAGGELLLIDRSGSPQGVRCVRLAERARLLGIFGRVFRDREGRLTIAPLSVLAMSKGLELYRL